MRVTLVNPNRYVEPPVIPVGLEYLAGPLELAGHEVALCDLTFSADPGADLSDFLDSSRPGAIGFTVRNIDNCIFNRNRFFLDEIARLVGLAAGRGVPVLVGGASTLCSVEALGEYLGADTVLLGPGERALPDLLSAIEGGLPAPAFVDGWQAGIIPGLAHERGSLVDYAPYLEGGNPAGLEFRKGCHWGCGFCVERLRPVMAREVAAVVEEARSLARAGASRFFFCDPEVNLDLHETRLLLEALARADTGLTWSGYFRPVPFDGELARAMRAAGCTDLTLSVESWELSEPGGSYGPEDVADFLELCSGEGIKTAVDLLVGYPGEEAGSVSSAISLLGSLPAASVAVNEYLRLYETTPLGGAAVRADAGGKLCGDADGNRGMLKPVFFSGVDREWLRRQIAGRAGFVMSDDERTVNYLRLAELGPEGTP